LSVFQQKSEKGVGSFCPFFSKNRKKGSVLFVRFLSENFVFFNISTYLCPQKINNNHKTHKLCPEN